MGVTNYATIGGVMFGETGPSGTQYYHTDALGSVTMTTDQNSNVLNTYRYKPYGAQLSKTGTAPDPQYTWVGSLGYRTTSRIHRDYYVRARHYASAEGAWTSVDPLWPAQLLFGYVKGSPTSNVDPSGKLIANLQAVTVYNQCGVGPSVLMQYVIDWSLTFNPSFTGDKSGAIIQVNPLLIFPVNDCDGNVVSQVPYFKCNEAWSVDSNGQITPYTWLAFPYIPINDVWRLGVQKETAGAYTQTSTVAYFKGFSLAQYPKGGCAGRAFNLGSDAPNFGSADSNTLQRSVTFTWSDCPNKKSCTISGN